MKNAFSFLKECLDFLKSPRLTEVFLLAVSMTALYIYPFEWQVHVLAFIFFVSSVLILWTARLLRKVFDGAVHLFRCIVLFADLFIKDAIIQLDLSLRLFGVACLGLAINLAYFFLISFFVLLLIMVLSAFAYRRFKVFMVETKVLRRTAFVGVSAFALYFFYEVVPPYDHPQATFTYRFFDRLDFWVAWIVGRIIRWFTRSGF